MRFRQTSKIRTKPLSKPEPLQDQPKPSGPSLIIRQQSSSGNFSEFPKPLPPSQPPSSATTSTPKAQLPSLKLTRPIPVPVAPAPLSASTNKQPHSSRTILKLSTKSLASLKTQSTAPQQHQQGGTAPTSPATITAAEVAKGTSIPENVTSPAEQGNHGGAAAATASSAVTSPVAQPKIPKLKLRIGSFASASATSTPTSAGQGLKRKSP